MAYRVEAGEFVPLLLAGVAFTPRNILDMYTAQGEKFCLYERTFPYGGSCQPQGGMPQYSGF